MKYIIKAIKEQYPTEIRNYVGLRVCVECLEEELQETTPDKDEVLEILRDIDESIDAIRKGLIQ